MFEDMLIPRIAKRVKLIRTAKHPTFRKNEKKKTQEELYGENRAVISAIENGRIRKGNRSYLPFDTLLDLSEKLEVNPQDIVFGDISEQKAFIKDIFDLISLYSYLHLPVKNNRHNELMENAEKKLWHLFRSRAKFSYLFAEIDNFATQEIAKKMQDKDSWSSIIKETFKETRESFFMLFSESIFESFQSAFMFNQEEQEKERKLKRGDFIKIDEVIISWIDTEVIKFINDMIESRKQVPIYMIGYQVKSLMEFAYIQIDNQLRINSPEMFGKLLNEVKKKQEQIFNLSISMIYFKAVEELIVFQENGIEIADESFAMLDQEGRYSLYK